MTHVARTRRTAAARDDLGSSAIELVLVTPVLIALVFGLIQTALVWNARHTVSAAAHHGAREARSSTALAPSVTAAFAQSASVRVDAQVRSSTLTYLRQIGGQALKDPTVAIRHETSEGGSFVIVTVSGTTLGLLPGTTVRVSSSSRTPLEGFRP